MGNGTTPEVNVVQLRRAVRTLLHQSILEAVEHVLEVELQDALGAEWYERKRTRRGYRNGSEMRSLTTPNGLRTLLVPRARMASGDETTQEFRSEILPRYARRTREVDEAILSIHLAGGNSRRIRKVLEPLLGTEHLSKSAVSRVVSRLKTQFADWSGRDLSEERYAMLFLDGFALKVRMARRVVSVPVLAALGVAPDGTKRRVALRLALSEAGMHWAALVTDLQRRGLVAPLLLISDGHPGLKKAMEFWPAARVQRCTHHKWENLARHCPRHAHRELRRDYHRIIYARDGLMAREAYESFLAKWSKLCPAVAKSLEEAGELLLTFYEFPRSMWKSLRSTNPLENLNREFRRRTKTQSFSTEEAGVTLLYGLVVFGHIQLRRIDGYQSLPALLAEKWQSAA